MTATEWKTEFSMWAIAASPLQFTAAIMNCSQAPAPPAPSCSVSLVKQTSISACTAGVSFGCDATDASKTPIVLVANKADLPAEQQTVAYDEGEALAVGLTLADIAEWPGLLQDVTADEVMTVARAVLQDRTSVTGWLQAPEGATP